MADFNFFNKVKNLLGSGKGNNTANNQLIKPALTPPSEKSLEPLTKEQILYKDYQLPYNRYGSNLDITNDQSVYDPAMVRQIINSPVWFPKYQLYSTMEVQWPKVAKSMDYLKNSVGSKKFVLRPSEEGNADAERKCDLVKQAEDYMKGDPINNINSFQDMIKNIVSAYGFGLCLQKYNWDQVDGVYIPWGTRLVSGYLYEYSIPNENIYLKMQGGSEEIDARMFLLSVYKNRSTPNMSTYGMYQSLAMLYSYQNYAKQFLMKLSEKFGVPLVKGTYPTNADDAFKQAFNSLLSNFGNSLFIGGPAGCEIELIESSINASNNPQQALLEYCDKMADLVLIGNDLTSDSGGGGSRALGEVHERKENNVIDNLSQFVLDNLNNQFVKSILMMNGETLDNAPIYGFEKEVNLDLFLKKLTAVQQLNSTLKEYQVDESSFEEECAEYEIVLKKRPPVELDQPNTSGSIAPTQTTPVAPLPMAKNPTAL